MNLLLIILIVVAVLALSGWGYGYYAARPVAVTDVAVAPDAGPSPLIHLIGVLGLLALVAFIRPVGDRRGTSASRPSRRRDHCWNLLASRSVLRGRPVSFGIRHSDRPPAAVRWGRAPRRRPYAAPPGPGERGRPGGRVPAVRVRGWPGRLGLTGFVRNQGDGVRGRGRGGAGGPGPVPGRARRPPAAAGPHRRRPVESHPAGATTGRSGSSRAGRQAGRPAFLPGGRGHLPGVPGRAVRPGRPPVPLSVPQLHQLRAAADDHPGTPRTTASGRRWRRSPCAPRAGAEYDDPADRRFHAQPTACPACGPRLRLLDACGTADRRTGPARPAAVRRLRGGRIGAVKGLADTTWPATPANDAAVAELRRRKHRDEKPFAVMVADLAAAARLCEVAPAEARPARRRRARPIVLLRAAAGAGRRATRSRPGNPYLGVMLPYTPLHHLLLRDVRRARW